MKATAELLDDEITGKGLKCSTSDVGGRWRETCLWFFSQSVSNTGVFCCCCVDLRRADWHLVVKLVFLQHALKHTEGQRTNSDDDSCLFTFHISYVSDCTGAAQCLTVRLLIPSENAPICLTVPSESSICQEINKQTNRKQTNQIQTEEPNWTSWSVSSERSWAAAEASPYLFQVFQVLLVDQDSSSLEAAALWHFHVHGADVLLAIILTFLPQSAKTAERQTSGLNETKGDGLS